MMAFLCFRSENVGFISAARVLCLSQLKAVDSGEKPSTKVLTSSSDAPLYIMYKNNVCT